MEPYKDDSKGRDSSLKRLTPKEHVVGGVEVVDGHLACGHDAEEGQGHLQIVHPITNIVSQSEERMNSVQPQISHHGNHGCDGQGERLSHPVASHHQDDVGTLHCLRYLDS
jgi:hypothetical protein